MGRGISGMGLQQIGWIGAVGCLALGLQSWLWWISPVPSLDAVRFVRSAARIEHIGLAEGLCQVREAPLWIVWLWAVHQTVIALWGETPWAWAWSVQLAALVPLVAGFALTARLAIRLWGTRRGIWAGLLFLTLPETARLGVDGLSDSLHLAFAAGAILVLVEAVGRVGRKSAFLWSVAGGILCGLASLVRAEVLAIGAAWVGTWGFLFWQQKHRVGLAELLTFLGLFLLGFGGVLGTYAKTTRIASWEQWRQVWSGSGELNPSRNFSPPSLSTPLILGSQRNPLPEPAKSEAPLPEAENSPRWNFPDGTPLCFDAKEPSVSIRRRGWGKMLLRSVHKTADVWGYWVGVFALVGLWKSWRNWRRQARPIPPETIFLLLTAGGVLAGAFAYGAGVGYLEARHLLLMVVCGIGAAGAGVDWVGRWLAKRLSSTSVAGRKNQPGLSPFPRLPHLQAEKEASAQDTASLDKSRWGGRLRLVPLGAAVLASLLVQVGGVHGSRLGHRQAGDYLAHHASGNSIVVDTRGWTGLYSGRTTYLYSESAGILSDRRLEYFVVESGELASGSRRAETLRFLLQAAGERIGVFPHQENADGITPVEVYRWDTARFQKQRAVLAKPSSSLKSPETPGGPS